MVLADGIIAAITVVVVVFVVVIALTIFCIWTHIYKKKCCESSDDDADDDPVTGSKMQHVPGGVVVIPGGGNNLFHPTAMVLPIAAAPMSTSSSVNRSSRRRRKTGLIHYNSAARNTYLTPAAAAAVNSMSRSVSHDQHYVPSNTNTNNALASGATSLRVSAARSETDQSSTSRSASTHMASSARGINNTSSVTFADHPHPPRGGVNYAVAASSAALQMPRNSPDEHVPMSRRLADGAHLYYIFPDGDEDPDLAPASKNNNSSSSFHKSKHKSFTAKKRSNNSNEVVMELDLVDVGLGSETSKYIAFALMAELAAKHLPTSFEWKEGHEPPMCLAGEADDENEDENKDEDVAKAPASKDLVVLDVEKLVGNAESIAETATWPLTLFIVERKVKPGQKPLRVSLLEHQIKKAAETQHLQQQQQQQSATSSSFLPIPAEPNISSINYTRNVRYLPNSPSTENSSGLAPALRGASLGAASASTAAAYSTTSVLFDDHFENKSMMLPLLAPRIYPYTPTVTTRTPIRITATQFRCRRTGALVQDRWKVFALDEVLAQLPAAFLRLVIARNSKQAMIMTMQQQQQQQRGGGGGLDDETEDKALFVSAEDASLLDQTLPKTIEFSSRRSSVSTNHVPLPHLTVTAARDGTLFVKSVPKKAKKKKKRKEQSQLDQGDDDQQQQQQPKDSTQEGTSDVESVSTTISSYSQSTVQLLHVDVIPMPLMYKIEGGVSMGTYATAAAAAPVPRASTSFADVPWHSIDAEGNHDNSNFMNISSNVVGRANGLLSLSQNQQQHRIFLPLGRVCVVAKTRQDSRSQQRVGGITTEPSWSTVYTVSAATREDTTDYSKSATVQFAGI